MPPKPSTDLSFLPLGANLHTFTLPRTGTHPALPLVLSLPDQAAYVATGNPAFFGETIGRVANRIRSAQITLNGGTAYPLARNNGPNTLHGGHRGWGKRLWQGPFPEHRRGTEAVRFEYVSPDGEEGFPGTVRAKAWYLARETSLDDDDDDDADGGDGGGDGGEAGGRKKKKKKTTTTTNKTTELEVEYEVAFEDPDRTEKGAARGEDVVETAVNVTNHTAFSIGPEPEPDGDPSSSSSRSLAGTRVRLYTDRRQEVDEQAIPTGAVTKHEGVEVGRELVLGPDGPRFDDCFVLSPDLDDPAAVPLDTRTRGLRKLADFYHPDTKVRFEVESTEPAFQFYTGEFIDLEYGGKVFRRRAGFCVEASRYVDAAGKDEWRGQVLLKRGQVWGSRTVYRAWRDE